MAHVPSAIRETRISVPGKVVYSMNASFLKMAMAPFLRAGGKAEAQPAPVA
jgi:hypothetical protein